MVTVVIMVRTCVLCVYSAGTLDMALRLQVRIGSKYTSSFVMKTIFWLFLSCYNNNCADAVCGSEIPISRHTDNLKQQYWPGT